MNKIFSKLKLILTITILLISLLFSILIYRQYTQFQKSKATIDTTALTLLDRDITMILDFHKNLAKTYFDQSLKDNKDLQQLLNKYNNPLEAQNLTYHYELSTLLTPIFNNLKSNHFSYINVYDYTNTLITTISDSTTTKESNYTYKYPIFSETSIVGYVELGLSVEAVIASLERTTDQSIFTIFNKHELDDSTLANYQQNYITSSLSDQYYVNTLMMETYASYKNSYDLSILDDFSMAVRPTINSRLGQQKSFIISNRIQHQYYSIVFIPLDKEDNIDKGYFVLFKETQALTALHENFNVSVGLLIGLYLTLLFIIIFIYYILHYLYHFSYTDHLTKAYNRHKFFEVIKRNIYDFHRYNYMFSVILLDIDNFKAVNDQLGHNVGDEVLIQFVEIIESSLRTTDYLFRWGGEEFLVLLSHCDAKIGYQVAEKLRQNIESYDFKLKKDLHISASLGVSSYKNATNVENMISQADKALYISKNRGKNCTTLFTQDLNEPIR